MAIANEQIAERTTPRTVVEDTQGLGGKAMDMAQEKIEQVRAGAAEYAKEGCEKVRDVGHTIEGYVREQPIKVMLIAAGVGVGLGMVAGRFWMGR